MNIKGERLTTDFDAELNQSGFAIVRGMVSPDHCEEFKNSFDKSTQYRKEIDMKRYRFGSGLYKYFSYPLPPALQVLREQLYARLVETANRWNDRLGISFKYPDSHRDFIRICNDGAQTKPTPLILRYETGDYNTLHQDLYGKIYFPLQAIILLSEPDKDFTGGEIVLTEQRPRAQSVASVIQPRKGDAVILTTNFRPVLGKNGYYRAAMRHGVSRVTSGKRFTLGLIMHDAMT